MKKKLLFGLILLLASCNVKDTKIYCEWEIIYPDTTILYKDTMIFLNNDSQYCTIHSSQGSNRIDFDNGGSCIRLETVKYPISSTCPMRLIKYKFIEEQ